MKTLDAEVSDIGVYSINNWYQIEFRQHVENSGVLKFIKGLQCCLGQLAEGGRKIINDRTEERYVDGFKNRDRNSSHVVGKPLKRDEAPLQSV